MANNVTIAECDAEDELLDDYPSEKPLSKKKPEEIEWVEIDDDEVTENILTREDIIQSFINPTTLKDDRTSDPEDNVDETMHIT